MFRARGNVTTSVEMKVTDGQKFENKARENRAILIKRKSIADR